MPQVPPLRPQEGGAWSRVLFQNSQGAERPAREPGPKGQLARPCSPDSESRPERVPTPRSCSALGNRGYSDAEGRGGALMCSACRAGDRPGLQTPLWVLPGTATSSALSAHCWDEIPASLISRSQMTVQCLWGSYSSEHGTGCPGADAAGGLWDPRPSPAPRRVCARGWDPAHSTGEGGMNLIPRSPLTAHATGPERLMILAIKKVDFFPTVCSLGQASGIAYPRPL